MSNFQQNITIIQLIKNQQTTNVNISSTDISLRLIHESSVYLKLSLIEMFGSSNNDRVNIRSDTKLLMLSS